MIDRLFEILRAPVEFPEMIWVLIPLVVTILLVEFYFSRYKYEERGWENSYGNSMILIFVSLNLLGYMYNSNTLATNIANTAFSIAVGVMGILLLILNFFHALPEQLAYGVSSALPVNFLAYMAVIIIYSNILIDYTTVFASILFLIMWSVFIWIVNHVIPSALSPKLLKEEVPEPEKSKKR